MNIKRLGLILVFITLSGFLWSQSTSKPFSNSGGSTSFIPSSGSGGGGLTAQTLTNITSGTLTVTGQGSNIINIEGGVGVATNAVNNWTQLQNFTNINVRGSLGVNTNLTSGSYTVIVHPKPGVTGSHMLLKPDAGGESSIGLLATDGSIIEVGLTGVDARYNATGGSLGDVYFTHGVSSTIMLRYNASTLTYGQNSSTAHAWNGSTFTFNQLANINGGNLMIGAAGSTVTNQSSFTSLGSMTATNFSSSSPNLVGNVNSGTSTNLIFTANAGAGLFEFVGRMNIKTNTFLGTTPLLNAIYTNDTHIMRMRCSVALPATTTAGSMIGIWTVDAGTTQIISQVSSLPNVGSIGVTNTITAEFNPVALWSITNLGSQTPVLVLPSYREIR